jgi:hypothetical protein
LTAARSGDRKQALEVLRAVKARVATIKASFEENVKTAHAAWKAAVAHRDSFLDPLAKIEAGIRAAAMRYDTEQERIRQAEQARLQAIADEQARKERERLEREAAKLKTPELREARLEQAAMVTAPIVNVPAPEKVEGESSATVTKWELVNEAELPREYLTPDTSKIGKMVRAGITAIPGVRIWKEKSLRMAK